MYNQEYYADLYVKRKKELLPLIEQFYGPLPINVSHAELIVIYVNLLKNSQFVDELDKLSANFRNAAAVDPVSAIAEAIGKLGEGAGKIFSGSVRTSKIQADAQTDAFMYQMILTKQGTDNTGKILLFSGLAVLVIGVIITAIILKRKA